MKRTTPAILVFLLLAALPLSAQTEEDRWYPFVIPQRLEDNSPANIGKIVLDPPGGKHGFVTVQDGHFYFADGTRAKFWGTNLAFGANFPDKKDAVALADRLAFFGFNAVRLHHMDFYFEPRGIFEDTAPARRNAQDKETGTLSPQQLDRLDYLIYELKKRGIYVDLNLLVARHFTEADGIADAQELPMAAKPASMFDPKLIELQKKYARDLLTRTNKYTQLKYSDDPAIALVEITNENSIFLAWKSNELNGDLMGSKKKALPDHYVKELDVLWNQWLKEKYQSVDLLKKAWGQSDDQIQDFQFPRPFYKLLSFSSPQEQEDIKAFYLSLERRYFAEMKNFLTQECGLKAPVTGIGGYRQPEDIEAQQDMDFIDYHAYWDHPKFPNKDWDSNDFIIHDMSMLADEDLGMVKAMTKAKDLVVDKPFTMTEWHHCAPNRYAYETPILMAAFAGEKNIDGLFQFAFSHGWKVHPEFNVMDGFFNILANPQQLLLNQAAHFLFQQTGPLQKNIADGVLTIDAPRMKGVIGFIKDKKHSVDELTVSADQDGAVVLYAVDGKPINASDRLILITLSEVKNSRSGWKEEKFDWGRKPVLLKKMDGAVQLQLNKELKVYSLTPQGKRDKLLPVLFDGKTIEFATDNFDTPWFEITRD